MTINFQYLIFQISIILMLSNDCIEAANNVRNEINLQNNEIKKRIDTKIEYAKQQLKNSESILEKNPNDSMEQDLKTKMLDYINYLTKLKNKHDISNKITPLELNMLGLLRYIIK